LRAGLAQNTTGNRGGTSKREHCTPGKSFTTLRVLFLDILAFDAKDTCHGRKFLIQEGGKQIMESKAPGGESYEGDEEDQLSTPKGLLFLRGT